jgi:hypothetical protein
LQKLLQLGAFVVLVDEFLTSQCCAIDGNKLVVLKESMPLRPLCGDCLADDKSLHLQRFNGATIDAARKCLWPTIVNRFERLACEKAWLFFESTVASMSTSTTKEKEAASTASAAARTNDGSRQQIETPIDCNVECSKQLMLLFVLFESHEHV